MLHKFCIVHFRYIYKPAFVKAFVVLFKLDFRF